MKRYSYTLILILLTLLAAGCGSQDQKQPSPSTEDVDRSTSLNFTRTVAFLTAEGDTVATINAAISDNDQERSQGLMDVQQLPASKGMLFIFEENKPRGFWMANTPLPLDIFFINADKEIVRIHHSTQPFSEQSLESGQPAKYVIETNAGYAVSHDIQEGMNVAF